MIERIRELLNEREWTFASLLNMEGIVDEISTTIFNEMSHEKKLELVWKQDVYDEIMNKISEKVADLVKEELMQAKVSFGDKNEVNENEISERSMGREPSEERSTDEAADSEE
tara:strand:+ start:741 stop:1079 length:339 start_codon:yes stop_codon:yes gene_type:complete